VSARGYRARRVVTCDPQRSSGGPLGVLEDGALVVGDEGRLVYVGLASEAPAGVALEDLGDLVTPGLVDAHTHAAWVGSRHAEYLVRMNGGTYADIAAAGGGILSSSRAVAAASEGEIAHALRARVARMVSLGVTCVEVKSGYGLEAEGETKQLRAIAQVAAERTSPKLVATYLALHALPVRARTGEAARAAYVREVIEQTLPAVAREKLARFVDAYVDTGAFTVDEARALGSAAIAQGLGVRLHVGQFADIGGAELAAELGALSADHLEVVSAAGIAALAAAGVRATLLPTACFTLGQEPPPVAALRAAGVPLVVASDANPGTAPTESLPLALAFAVRTYGLSAEEAILGATRHAADALAEPGRGRLAAGMHADFVAWDLPHEHALVQPWGTPMTRRVVRDGVVLLRDGVGQSGI
jgi:imidazolonepropionase